MPLIIAFLDLSKAHALSKSRDNPMSSFTAKFQTCCFPKERLFTHVELYSTNYNCALLVTGKSGVKHITLSTEYVEMKGRVTFDLLVTEDQEREAFVFWQDHDQEPYASFRSWLIPCFPMQMKGTKTCHEMVVETLRHIGLLDHGVLTPEPAISITPSALYEAVANSGCYPMTKLERKAKVRRAVVKDVG